MMPSRIMTVAVALALLALRGRSLAGEDAFKIIANADVSIEQIDRDVLRDIYLKKLTELDGHGVHPIQLSHSSVSDRFAREVLRKTPAQLKSYWSQQIFSGKGVPPPEADSPAAVISYVVEHPGAIGYIPSNVEPGRAHVVQLR